VCSSDLLRDPVAAVEPDPVDQRYVRGGEFGSEHLGDDAHDQMRAIARQHLRPLPRYRDARFRIDGFVMDGQGQRVDDVQSQTECVVSRSQIRRGGRNLELQPHAQLSSRPRARAALTASTETRWVSISEPSAVCSAQDGSLSPCPVTVTAIVAESGTLPASAVLSSPATEAAEPGS